MDLELRGKSAFVSGASAGIGKAIALQLAKEGCDVAVHGRDKARSEETAHAVEALGVKAIVTLGDLGKEDDCDRVAKETLSAFEAADIVVNNAGIALRKDDPGWSEIPFQTWLDSFEINFMSTLRMSKHFLPGIKARGWGRVVNISSGSAHSTPVMTEYSSAKAALNKLTADMARDVGRYGATVNGIAPGVIMTAAVEEWLATLAKQHGWEGGLTEWEARFMTDMMPYLPVKRFGRADDIAALAVFLASPAASYITGVTFRVDGGSARFV